MDFSDDCYSGVSVCSTRLPSLGLCDSDFRGPLRGCLHCFLGNASPREGVNQGLVMVRGASEGSLWTVLGQDPLQPSRNYGRNPELQDSRVRSVLLDKLCLSCWERHPDYLGKWFRVPSREEGQFVFFLTFYSKNPEKQLKHINLTNSGF